MTRLSFLRTDKKATENVHFISFISRVKNGLNTLTQDISRLKCCPSCCENGWRWSIVIKGQKNMIRNCRRYNLQCTVIQANKKPWNIFQCSTVLKPNIFGILVIQCSTVSVLWMNPGSDRTIWMSFLPSEGPFFSFHFSHSGSSSPVRLCPGGLRSKPGTNLSYLLISNY